MARAAAVVGWLSWTAAIVWLWWGWRSHVDVPDPSWFLAACAAGAIAVVGATVVGVARFRRKSDRRDAARWTVLAHGPTILVAAHATYAVVHLRSRELPRNVLLTTGEIAGATIILAETGGERRMTADNVVMIGATTPTPDRELEAMDRFVGRQSALLGLPLRSRVSWVRSRTVSARVCGHRGLALRSVVIGQQHAPELQVDGLDIIDRHEVAHAVLNQFLDPATDVPAALFEGWAEAQAWPSERAQLRAVLGSLSVERLRQIAGPVRRMFDPGEYHSHTGMAYPLGGLLVRFLLETHGARAFLDLVNHARPDDFEDACRRVLGVSLDELDPPFWSHLAQVETD
jgi:hypothetical protein